jgi:hypothetical protein
MGLKEITQDKIKGGRAVECGGEEAGDSVRHRAG